MLPVQLCAASGVLCQSGQLMLHVIVMCVVACGFCLSSFVVLCICQCVCVCVHMYSVINDVNIHVMCAVC